MHNCSRAMAPFPPQRPTMACCSRMGACKLAGELWLLTAAGLCTAVRTVAVIEEDGRGTIMPIGSCACRMPSGDRSLYPGHQAGELDAASPA